MDILLTLARVDFNRLGIGSGRAKPERGAASSIIPQPTPLLRSGFLAPRGAGEGLKMTPTERTERRIAQPNFWNRQGEKTLDQATAMMPKLLYERLAGCGKTRRGEQSAEIPAGAWMAGTNPAMTKDIGIKGDHHARPCA
jgi:hypothetical protein